MMPHDGSVSEHPTFLGWLADRLIRHRRALFITGVVLSVVAFVPASKLELEESVESFYAADNPYLLDYLRSKHTFGGDEFVFVAYTDPQLLEPEGLRRVEEFAARLSAVPGVNPKSTQDLATTLAPPAAGFAVRMFLRFPRTHENLMEFSRNVLIGDDNQTTAIVLRLLPEDDSPVPRTETFRQIRRLAETHELPTYVTGEPIMIHDMFRYVEQDGWILGIASSSLLILVILIFFRSLRWTVLPLLVVHAALVWTKAILVASGMQLSMVSSILTSLITIIGIATVTHVTVRFRELRTQGFDRTAAFRQTVIDLTPPTFWSIATTAVGFATLFTSGVTPVRSFGTMVSLGTMLVLVAVGMLVPGGVLMGSFGADPHQPPGERRLIGILRKMSDGVEHRPLLLLIILTAVSAVSAAGLFRLRVETDFTKNFRADSPIVEAVRYFEDRLGGVGIWEVTFDAPREDDSSPTESAPQSTDESDGDAANSDAPNSDAPNSDGPNSDGMNNDRMNGDGLTEPFLDRVARTSEQLRAITMPDGTGPTKVISLADGVDFIPRIAARSLDQKREVLATLKPEFEESLYNRELGRMRITLRALEQQPAETKLHLIARAEQVARQEFPEAKATGLYVLLAHLIESLLGDQLTSFSLAAAIILVMMTVAFRSLPVGIAMLVPNTFPILLVIGGMGWLGVPVNIGTAMIASVSMGLTIDSSIHYLAGYRRARSAGLDHFGAIHKTHEGIGRSLVFANVALVAGFTVLALSNFIPLVYFGILVSVSMLGGLVGGLLFLPLLLYWIPVPD